MERLTEPYGKDYFRLCGNKTVYSRKPARTNRIAYALAKLFYYEDSGLEPGEIDKLRENKIAKKPEKAEENNLYCPCCGSWLAYESDAMGDEHYNPEYCQSCGQHICWVGWE